MESGQRRWVGLDHAAVQSRTTTPQSRTLGRYGLAFVSATRIAALAGQVFLTARLRRVILEMPHRRHPASPGPAAGPAPTTGVAMAVPGPSAPWLTSALPWVVALFDPIRDYSHFSAGLGAPSGCCSCPVTPPSMGRSLASPYPCGTSSKPVRSGCGSCPFSHNASSPSDPRDAPPQPITAVGGSDPEPPRRAARRSADRRGKRRRSGGGASGPRTTG